MFGGHRDGASKDGGQRRTWDLQVPYYVALTGLKFRNPYASGVTYWDKPPHKVLLNVWRNKRIREQLEVGSPLLPREFWESNSAFRFGSNHGCLLSHPGNPPPVSSILSDTKLYSPMITKYLRKAFPLQFLSLSFFRQL